MNALTRLAKLVSQGTWSFYSDGVLFTRPNLSYRARFNLILQLISKQLRLESTLGIPYSLVVEPASVCNLNCVTCPAGQNHKMCSPAILRMEDFQKTIDLIGEYITFIQMWSWGEPCLHPQLPEMIAYARSKDIVVITSTNAHFLNDDQQVARLVNSGLNELILAVDGTTQEVYDRFRPGGNLEVVLAGIRNLVRIKREQGVTTPRLHMRMVINPFNEDQKDEFLNLAQNLGVDVVSYKKVDIGMGGLSGDESMLPKNKDYIIESHYGDYPYKCVAFWGFPALSSSGHIGLCSLDAKRRTDLAHISTIDDFKQIWNSEKARKFRRAIKKDPDAFPFCRECICREPDFKNAYFDCTILTPVHSQN